MNEWYKQLFGESEGKDGKGLFPWLHLLHRPALHGQFIQEGSRTMFETIVDVKEARKDLFIDPLEGNFDGLNFWGDNWNMSVVNCKATAHPGSHRRRGVPEVLVEVDDLVRWQRGYLITSSGVPQPAATSAGVNPSTSRVWKACLRCWQAGLRRPDRRAGKQS